MTKMEQVLMDALLILMHEPQNPTSCDQPGLLVANCCQTNDRALARLPEALIDQLVLIDMMVSGDKKP